MGIARSTIRSMVQQRADIQGDTVRFPASELNQYINDSLKRFQGLLLKKGLLKTRGVQTISANGGTSYSLPTDYLATSAIFLVEGGSHTRLAYMQDTERALRQNDLSGDASQYNIYEWTTGSTREKRIELYPSPTSGTYKHVYVPVYTLDADTDELDEVLGWHEYIILDVAIKCYLKDNLDYSQLAIERERILQSIEDEAEARLLSETYVIQDVTGGSFGDASDRSWQPDYLKFLMW